LAAQQKKLLRLVTAPGESSVSLVQALVELHRAVKGAGFYPQGHPARGETLQRVFELFQGLLTERELVLTVNRQGMLHEGEAVEANAMVLQLAHEFFIRRISMITFMQDLHLADLETFVDMAAGDPHKAAAAGGFARLLELGGVSTIWINEKDLDVIWAKRARASFGEPEVDGFDALELETVAAKPAEKRTVPQLLELMAQEADDARYQALGRELIDRAEQAKPGEFAIVPLLEELLRQYREQRKSLQQREYALFVLKQLADGAAVPLLEKIESREYRNKEAIHQILAALGSKGAYWLIQRICLAPGLYERKALAVALVSLGSAAIAPTLAMLRDERWYVVRNMVAILGELRCADCLTELKKPLYHDDVRVRKEAVRALMKIGGEQAESALIPLLDEPEEGLLRHVVLSLGLMRSRQAVPQLLKLLERRDLLLKGLELKKELLVALGRIGDRRATGTLLKLLVPRGWPVLGRWLEFKIAVAAALGALGDEAALPALTALAAGSGALAEACREAQDTIERVSGGVHE
jgi:HEAT repeat protein